MFKIYFIKSAKLTKLGNDIKFGVGKLINLYIEAQKGWK
jgi:hypothetical protein